MQELAELCLQDLKTHNFTIIAIRRRPENKLNAALLKPTGLLTWKNDLNTFTDTL